MLSLKHFLADSGVIIHTPHEQL